ncbi:hypothetical protein [Tranquillimonas rosea]|uniref:hypothetical protein n=1 Tax=Tranquillimonas rosea TaxID=641238 RepID=UPI003BAA7834
MMQAPQAPERRSQFRPVDTNDLDDYPAELSDPKLTTDHFTAFWHDRWLNSELFLTAPLDVQAAALNLFFVARKQTPVGSLPDNDVMLAKLLRIELAAWSELRSRSISPLHNWRPYHHEGRIVLGHPVVIEVALDALHRREKREAAQSEKAIAERRRRLSATLAEMNCADAVCKDGALISWLDEWLCENHHGQRRMPGLKLSIQNGLNAAAREGRLNSARK